MRDSSGPNPEKISPEALREAALRYLDVRDASVDQLRRVLLRRVLRYGDEGTRDAAAAEIEALLSRFVDSKLLDDQRYAEGVVQSLARRGASRLKIQKKLMDRGLADALIGQALELREEGEPMGEEASARIFVQKKRLRVKYDLSDYSQRQKALAALARQGFSFEVASRALDL